MARPAAVAESLLTLVLFAVPLTAQPPHFPLLPQDLVSLQQLEEDCSKPGGSDTGCARAAAIALGREEAIEKVSQGDRAYTLTNKVLPADPSRAVWLYEHACANRLWQTCIAYAMVLERGEGLPADPVRSLAFLQSACAAGRHLVCEELRRRQIVIDVAPVMPPPLSGLLAPKPRPERTVQMPMPSLPPRPDLTMPPRPKVTVPLDQPVNADDPMEAGPVEDCRGGNSNSCWSLAKQYEIGDGPLARDAERAAYYYERACEEGLRSACEKVPGGASTFGRARAARARRAQVPFLILFGTVALMAVFALVIVRSARRAA